MPVIHVVGKYCVEDNLIRFQIKEYEMNAKELTCDAIYILKCATSDDVLAKLSDPENMTYEQLIKFLALLNSNNIKQYEEQRIICQLFIFSGYILRRGRE